MKMKVRIQTALTVCVGATIIVSGCTGASPTEGTTPTAPATLAAQPAPAQPAPAQSVAANPAGSTPTSDAPPSKVAISEVKVGRAPKAFGPGAIEITAVATVSEAVGDKASVVAKVSCPREDRLVVDAGALRPSSGSYLPQGRGEQVGVRGYFFDDAFDTQPAPCQMQFGWRPIGGEATATSLWCWDGHTTTVGACNPLITPTQRQGAQPLGATRLTMSRPEGTRHLVARAWVDVNEDQPKSTRLAIKAACGVGGAKLVDVEDRALTQLSFPIVVGETVPLGAEVFSEHHFDFDVAPTVCDLTLSRRVPIAHTYGDFDETILQRACYRAGRTASGPCDASSVRGAEQPTDARPGSIALTNVELELGEPYRNKGKLRLEARVDARLRQRVSYRWGISADVQCSTEVGQTRYVADLRGTDLRELIAGETARLGTISLGSEDLMDSRPDRCQVAFFAGRTHTDHEAKPRVALGTWCLRGGHTTGGSCAVPTRRGL